jgi:Peptidase family M50
MATLMERAVWWFPVFSLAFFIPGLHLSILVHESGHFLAAKRAGIQVAWVQIGNGQRLLSTRLFHVPVFVHLLPRVGRVEMVYRCPPTSHPAHRAIARAGMEANLVFMLTLVFPAIRSMSVLGGIASGFAVANLYSMVCAASGPDGQALLKK